MRLLRPIGLKSATGPPETLQAERPAPNSPGLAPSLRTPSLRGSRDEPRSPKPPASPPPPRSPKQARNEPTWFAMLEDSR